MKRSEINHALKAALRCFKAAGWALPPHPRWDVTDCGLGRFAEIGLVLVNLADHPEYCEKLMYAKRHQVLPLHTHRRKKEDIICRAGRLAIELWKGHPKRTRKGSRFSLLRNGEPIKVRSGETIVLQAGERVTIDDAHDNFFVDPRIGRFPQIEEDERPFAHLLWEKPG
jgi:D-lyxose ketol-isomerase